MTGRSVVAILAAFGFLVIFTTVAILEGGKERRIVSGQVYWGKFLVDKAGISNGVVMIALTPLEDATGTKVYDVAGTQAVDLQVLQLAITALLNKVVVEVYVDPTEKPHPTIVNFYLTDKSVQEDEEAVGESETSNEAPESSDADSATVSESSTVIR